MKAGMGAIVRGSVGVDGILSSGSHADVYLIVVGRSTQRVDRNADDTNGGQRLSRLNIYASIDHGT